MLARKISRKIGYIVSSLILFTAQLIPFFVFTGSASANNDSNAINEDKVRICHATSSASNPYEYPEVSKSAVDGVGNGDHYLEHTGAIATSNSVAQGLKDDKIDWGDIIPPIEGVHAGLNWTTTGRAIWNNKCELTTIEVKKVLSPISDDGLFNLKIKGVVKASDVGNNGTTGKVYINEKDDITVGETAGTNSALQNYTTNIVCRNNNGAGSIVEQGNPASSTNRDDTIDDKDIDKGDVILCIFINTRTTGKLKVVKDVINDNGGSKTYANFTFKNNLGIAQSFNASNSPDGEKIVELPLGSAYSITETEANSGGYATTYSAGCTGTVMTSQQTCIIANNDIAPKFTLVKEVSNDNGGNALLTQFNLTVGGNTVQSGSTNTYSANVPLALNETQLSGYSFVSIIGDAKCPVALGGTVTLASGDDITCIIKNDDKAPLLTLVKKVINDNGGKLNADNFGIAVSGTSPIVFGSGFVSGYTTTYTSTSAVTSNTDYTISEQDVVGYAEGTWNCSDGSNGTGLTVGVRFDEGEDVTCTITNNDQSATIIATKIVCDNESLLPNWGASGGPNVSSTTAIDWVTKNSGCKLASGWNFDYALNNASNPGDNKEVGGAGWTAFGPTDADGQTSTQISDLSNVNRIWVREQLKPGYLGFTYNVAGNNNNNVSAELYCNKDVLNYDNFDYIDNPTYESTYYCVAWNVRQAKILVHKSVTNDNGGTADSEDFSFTVNGQNQQNFANKDNYVKLDVNPGEYTISETENELYGVSYDGCENIKVESGNVYNCYVVNDDITPELTVYKTVYNNYSGIKKASDFTMNVAGNSVSDESFPGSKKGTTVTLDYGSYAVTEGHHDGYEVSYSDGCQGTINIGEKIECYVINEDIPNPSISIEKYGPETAYEGDEVEYIFYVYNDGDVDLTSVDVEDNIAFGMTFSYSYGGNDENNVLEVGETWVYYATYKIPTNTTENVLNTATACADMYTSNDEWLYKDSFSEPLDVIIRERDTCDTDTHELDVLHPAINVVKTGPASATAGSTVSYTFTVTNTGDVALDSIELKDSITGDGVYVSGDTDNDHELDLNETWIFTGKYTIPANQILKVVNTVKACGNSSIINDQENDESRLTVKQVKVCDDDTHSLGIPQVLGETIIQKPAVLADTGQSSSLNLVAGLVLITAAALVQLNRRTEKSYKK